MEPIKDYSELVWQIYRRALGIEIGKRHTIRDFDLPHPAVQEKRTRWWSRRRRCSQTRGW